MATADPRAATVDDALDVARLLDAFNREYDEPSPGVEVLARRLRRLLADPAAFAVLVEHPPAGLALVSLRPNPWYDGPVATLDELYVVPHLRDRGRGSALLAAVEDACGRRGVERVEIGVDGEDVDARRFYERHGYTCAEPGGTAPDLCYARELGPTS